MRPYIMAPILMAGAVLADTVSDDDIALVNFRLSGVAGMTPAGEPTLSEDGTSVRYALSEFDAYISSDFTITPMRYYAHLTLAHPETLGFRVTRNILRAKIEVPENVTARIASGVYYNPGEVVASIETEVEGGEHFENHWATAVHDFGGQDLDIIGCGEGETWVAVSTTLEIEAEGDAEGAVYMSSGVDEVELQEIQLEWLEC